MKLEEIADLSIGILTNREVTQTGQYEYKLFNLKSYEEKKEYQLVKTKKDFSNKTTKKGDLLFRLVAPNKIIYIEEEDENLLVPSQLCIIRSEPSKINAMFLKWYLESQAGKEKIKLELIGSSIQKISVASLRKMEIPEIDRDKQENIKDLIEVWNREKEVMQALITTKEMLYWNIIEQLIKGGETIGTGTIEKTILDTMPRL